MNREEFQTERTRIISEMLDNPDEYGIYPTTKCFEQLDALFDSLSLPPAEGAEEISNAILAAAHDYDTKIRNHEEETADSDDYIAFVNGAQWMREFASQPQPTSEGAEEIRKEYSEESLGFFRSFIKARKELCAISPTETYSLEEAIRKAFDGFFPKPLSIVNDAETILNSHPYLKVWVETLFDSEMKVCSIEQAIWAIERAATLHAQRIAEKMVEEKWINVKDGLPEKDGKSSIYCLVNSKYDGIVVRPYNEYHKCWDAEDADDYYCDAIDGKITHWMPLPNPPIK